MGGSPSLDASALAASDALAAAAPPACATWGGASVRCNGHLTVKVLPCPGVELKIADNGEVFYRSPGVFVEYYKNPESTADTKDPEGWVATGDAGFIEEGSGHLRIIDRAKDVGQMADGRLFAPKYVENKLKFFPNILETVVFGNQRSECTAFINIDLTAVGNWAERRHLPYAGYVDLAAQPDVIAMIAECVEQVNADLAADAMLAGSQIARFLILHKELDPDDDELTRTRKVRRGRPSLVQLGDGSVHVCFGADCVHAEVDRDKQLVCGLSG